MMPSAPLEATAASSATSAASAAPSSPQKPSGPRKSASLPPETVEYLKTWMMSPEHVAHPYPTEQEKARIMAETGIEPKQLANWFVNNRKRYWKPRVEARLQECQRQPGAVGVAAAMPAGGVAAAARHMNPNPAQAGQAALRSVLPANASSAPLYDVQRDPQGPASPHAQVRANFGPAGGMDVAGGPPVAAAVAAYRERDYPHTISDGSASSSASNSDDDSANASSRAAPRAADFATASQYPVQRPSSVNSGSSDSGAAPGVPCATGYRRHEEVDLHILRPDTGLPTLRDLTIKSSVPQDRVLATFKCPILYTIPYEIEHDRKKVQTRRDGEVLRVKKHYLKLYLATRGINSDGSIGGIDQVGRRMSPGANSTSSAPEETAVSIVASDPVTSSAPSQTRNPTYPSSAVASVQTAAPAPPSRMPVLTRPDPDLFDRRDESPDSNLAPRKRARTSSGPPMKGEDEWRRRCQNAKSLFCETLPGLEEAARMFGYVSPMMYSH